MKLTQNILIIFAPLIVALCCYASDHQKFNLIIPLFNEANVERAQEYITCLEKNLANPFIKNICVVYDSSKDSDTNPVLEYIKKKQLHIEYVTGRPTYSYCFRLAEKLYPNSKIILSNADIYFNETLGLLENFNLSNKFLALTRWNVKADGQLELFRQYPNGKFHKFNSEASQDTWIFETPLKQFKFDDIQIGTMTCDSRIAFQAYDSGLEIYNPCFSIQCCHLHLTNIIHHDTKAVKNVPIKTVPWITFEEMAHEPQKYILITTLYNEKNAERLQEYLTCLEKNIQHPLIKKIHIAYDSSQDEPNHKLSDQLQHPKITISFLKHPGRPTFTKLFEIANTWYPEQRVIVSNADIFFNDTLSLLDKTDLTGKFIALTRWNVTPQGTLEIFKQYVNGAFYPTTSARSQDTWIFKTPVPQFKDDSIRIGTWGCDIAIAAEGVKAGLEVYNPCKSIQACHLHLSNVRSYLTKSAYSSYIHFYVPWIVLDEMEPSKSANSLKQYVS